MKKNIKELRENIFQIPHKGMTSEDTRKLCHMSEDDLAGYGLFSK